MDFVTYLLFVLLVTLVGITPFFFLYTFSDFVGFILYRVIRYRKTVVRSNLKRAFPEKSEKELKQIEKASYKNLADLFIEGIKGFTMSKKSVMKRHRFLNPEILDQYYQQNRGVIVAAGHVGNWEWGAFSAAYYSKSIIVGLYKPLSNKYIDRFAIRTRAKAGTILVSIRKTKSYFQQYANKPSVFLMAADQSPSNTKKAIWTPFFGIDTPFLYGPEYYAKSYNLPVVFLHLYRTKRGMYEYLLEPMVEHPTEMAQGEITRMFASRLETLIKENPESWLWTHKRWKHVRSA
ncbi:MAG: lipid A biosynthesis acyltransferase [Bacteroidetes bacterium]|nr:MAG: lipid A biosynthesis acyltransferase [Bacteroidota bacterium]